MNLMINNVTKKYRKKTVINDLNLLIGNHIYGLVGPNGSGKTTLIRIILNLVKPSNGSVIFEMNNKIVDMNGISIGYLPQKFEVLKEFTVYEQLEYFALLKKIKKEEYIELIKKVLELTNLENEANTKCSNLSGGMIRRVGIAQAFLGKPDLIILDEPTVGLDPYERIRFKEMISKVSKDVPIILSTHIIEDISSLCTNVIILKSGNILFDSTVEEFENPKNMYVYKVDIDNINLITEKIIKVRIEDGYKIISTGSLNYSFVFPLEVTVDDAYLFLCNN